ncbi:DUF3800 domain-containing protein [Henriciella marina]|uniref:DUF3800 domain-containing protein n=1 Tax=Henriciella marina TaxID=453851 RepID=A0ABT4LRZ8_9PROT|nr:DUF3800 domain-containing protein [Henriciella marina]MCZ4297110.1 DUF3800 domain-containing protein [Henriciella marina]
MVTVFEKFFYGTREIVVFVDEAGDPKLADPNNPIFAFGACAVWGDKLNDTLRLPWNEVRKTVVGGESQPIHMRKLSRRFGKSKSDAIAEFFSDEEIKRASIVITDRTVFEVDGLPFTPVLQVAMAMLLKGIAKLMVGAVPMEAVSVIFEDGPLISKIREAWPHQTLIRNDGVTVPVSWATLEKAELEQGLEVADFIAHSAAGYMRHHRSADSKFSNRYAAIHPKNASQYSLGWEINDSKVIVKSERAG